jgi:hypothetical protein
MDTDWSFDAVDEFPMHTVCDPVPFVDSPIATLSNPEAFAPPTATDEYPVAELNEPSAVDAVLVDDALLPSATAETALALFVDAPAPIVILSAPPSDELAV